MGSPTDITVDPLSATSVYLKLYVEEQQLSTATGFVIENSGTFFLVTNWHVLSGRNPIDDQPLSPTAGIPDHVRIAHHIKGKLGSWRFHPEALYDDAGDPRWKEHPNGKLVDVAILELENIQSDTQIYPFDLSLADVDLLVQPAMTVSVIGFPLGLRPNAFFAIWKTGHVASDPDLPFDGRPAFLIDATTRSGMSGSPVVIRTGGPYRNSKGDSILMGGLVTKFLGVYSGRIHSDIEIGCVWHPETIKQILAAS